jgi:hypothetical protein
LPEKAVAVVSFFMASLEFFPKEVSVTTMPNPHPFAYEIKRHPEVETLLIIRDNRTEVMNRVLNWLMEGQEPASSTPMSLRGPISRAEAISSPLTGEDLGEGDIRKQALRYYQ